MTNETVPAADPTEQAAAAVLEQTGGELPIQELTEKLFFLDCRSIAENGEPVTRLEYQAKAEGIEAPGLKRALTVRYHFEIGQRDQVRIRDYVETSSAIRVWAAQVAGLAAGAASRSALRHIALAAREMALKRGREPVIDIKTAAHMLDADPWLTEPLTPEEERLFDEGERGPAVPWED